MWAARAALAKAQWLSANLAIRQLQTDNRIEHGDFLARVDTLGALGHIVMISNYLRYHRLVPFLRRLTAKRRRSQL